MKIITRKAALAAGLKRYFTGQPCKHGHTAERYILSKSCVICVRKLVAIRNFNRSVVRAAVYDKQRHSENISRAMKQWHANRRKKETFTFALLDSVL